MKTYTYITVSYNSNIPGTLIVYNAIGQIVLHTDIEAGDRKVLIQLPGLATGIYNYKCSFVDFATSVGIIKIIR